MKAAILGAGFIAEFHAQGYLHAQGVELCAVCDTDEGKARALAARYGCAWYTDAGTLLERERPELVSVCLPTYLHREYTVMALACGAHVLCEKPLALTLDDCEAIAVAAKQAQRIVMTGQVLRWWPEYTRIAAQIRRLGAPLYVRAQRLQHASRPDAWHLKRELGGGALFDLFVHDMDFLLGLFGTDAEVVSVSGSRGGGGSWRRVSAALRFKNGTSAFVEASNQMPSGYPFTAALHVQYPDAAIDYRFRTAVNIGLEASAETEFLLYDGGGVSALPLDGDAQARAFRDEIDAFVRSVRDGVPALPLEESIAVMRVICQIEKRLEEQQG
ncbi:MAG: Gfo/Idh/MocA family oxidoreductase [Clostridia bacterium]|nr:Gfo/Idh/MocA family oxidoreductase [Clostridia bacterium]